MVIQVQEAFRTPNKTRNDPLNNILWSKHQVLRIRKNNESSKRKHQVTYKGKPFRIIADFSTETLKSRRV
jgi:hypothetical protein